MAEYVMLLTSVPHAQHYWLGLGFMSGYPPKVLGFTDTCPMPEASFVQVCYVCLSVLK